VRSGSIRQRGSVMIHWADSFPYPPHLQTMHHDPLTRYEIAISGTSRHAFYHLPGGAPPDNGWPLVIALHGGGSTPRGMLHFTRLIDAADRHRFAVLFPAGSGPSPEFLTWNAGRCCGHAARRQVDDVGFLDALLDDALSRWPL